MSTEKDVGKYLWTTVVLLVTYLFIGSFIVSRSIQDLLYVIGLYATIIFVNIKK